MQRCTDAIHLCYTFLNRESTCAHDDGVCIPVRFINFIRGKIGGIPCVHSVCIGDFIKKLRVHPFTGKELEKGSLLLSERFSSIAIIIDPETVFTLSCSDPQLRQTLFKKDYDFVVFPENWLYH